MAFKGLEDRFQKRVSELYARSLKDGGPVGRNDQPFIEVKPNDPNRDSRKGDTRLAPIGAIKQDFTRMTRYLNSNQGRVFLVKAETMQLGNTFSETRIINPAFVIGNIQPYVHIRLPLAIPASFAVHGDTSQKSPASDSKIQSAGRLQVATSKDAIARVVGNSGASGLLAFLNPGKLVSTIVGSLGFNGVGSLGVNQRPELDVDGEYFSIVMWKGFRKQLSIRDNLNTAAANLRIGNITGALNSLKQGAQDFLLGVRTDVGVPRSAPAGRNTSSPDLDGRRYFITGKDTADRYLKNSMSFTVGADNRTRPVPHTAFLDRRPYVLDRGPTIPDTPIVPLTATQEARRITDTLTKVASQVQSSVGLGIPVPQVNPFSAATQGTSLADNPAEDDMLFPELSLHQRYVNDARIDFIRSTLQEQQVQARTYWQTRKVQTGMVGGVTPGAEQRIDPRQRSTVTSYLHDKLNEIDVIPNSGENDVSPQTVNDIRTNYGTDLVNVFFYDFVKKNTIPFRAYVSDIHESVTPEVNDTRYVGRIDRNVVYTGVTRELSFTLRAHAFNKTELQHIWRKINYVTGLCYPAVYSTGFMVPPLVKLTMGDVYRNQPGYFRNVTHTIEDDVSWETDPNQQIPHGITMYISFVVIERQQMQSDSIFYPYAADAALAAAQSIGTSFLFSPLTFI